MAMIAFKKRATGETPPPELLRLARLFLSERIAFPAVAIAATFCTACCLLSPIRFLTVDDIAIQRILSGVRFGKPSAFVFFSGYPVTATAAILYKQLPNIPWWLIINEVCVFLSLASTLYIVLHLAPHLARKLGVRRLITTLMLITACLILFHYPITRPSYTISAGVLAAASVALFSFEKLYGERFEGKPIAIALLCAFLIGLSYCMRSQAGIIGGIIMVATQLAWCIAERPRRQSPMLPSNWASLLFAAALIIAAITVDTIAYQGDEWQAFRGISSARSQYLDYAHDTYKESPDLYEAIGWNESLYRLVNKLCLMDPRVNKETLSFAAENSHVSKSQNVAASFIEGTGAFSSPYFSTITILLILTLLALSITASELPRSAWAYCVVPTLALVLGFTYLGMQGRFIVRAAYCVAFPALLQSATLLMLFCLKRDEAHKHDKAIALVLIIVICAVPHQEFITLQEAGESEAVTDARATTLAEYANLHPSATFVALGSFISTDPSNAAPANCMRPGGWTFYLPETRQVQAELGYPNGLDETYLLREDVYLATYSEKLCEDFKVCLAEIAEHDIEYLAAAQLDEDVVIYSFSLAENS